MELILHKACVYCCVPCTHYDDVRLQLKMPTQLICFISLYTLNTKQWTEWKAVCVFNFMKYWNGKWEIGKEIMIKSIRTKFVIFSYTHLKCKVQQAICLTSTFENHFRVQCMWVAENKKPIAIISMQICSKNVDAHQLWNSLKTNHGSSWNDDAFAIAQKSIAFLFWVVHSQLCVVRKDPTSMFHLLIFHISLLSICTRGDCVSCHS